MTVRCPQGHVSESTDYCDVCGTPLDAGSGGAQTPGADGSGVGDAGLGGQDPRGAGAGASVPGSAVGAGAAGAGDEAAAPGPKTCPHCGAVNVPEALFCESCGYDFTTGAEPLGDSAASSSLLDLGPAERAGPETGDDAGARASDAADDADAPDAAGAADAGDDAGVPAEPAASSGTGPDAADAAEAPEGAPAAKSASVPERANAAAAAPAAPPAPPTAPPGPPSAAPERPSYLPPSRRRAADWVVEVWVDPDWYAVQDTVEACPSPDVPDIVPVRGRSLLVGRPSASRSVRPDVDCGGDTAVSRRHAQLTSDGRRWWLEDLGSSNGTFVGPASGPLPTEPVPPGQRVELDVDDRVYVGAWTRLVLRRATESERSGTG